MHAVHTQPHSRAGAGAGLSPCHGLGEEGGGGTRPRAARWGGVRRPRQGPTLSRWAWGGVASTLCLQRRVGGRPPPACMPALVGGDWAGTPAHFSTGGGGGGRAPVAYPRPVTNRGAMGVL